MNNKQLVTDWLASWADIDGNVNSTEQILDWVKEIRQKTYVKIEESPMREGDFWYYDAEAGKVCNHKNSFFSIMGIRKYENGKMVSEQPIICQPEIGYLGIICKKIGGKLNLLMQAKIEPGNVNCVQISPTIQATKSNFTQVHGGKLPLYFEYFEQADKYHIIYDQIQSEQSSRFLKKRNRNIIILIEEDIPVYENYMWMTLGQIKKLMRCDNLINMDTRTVVSGIPFSGFHFSEEQRRTFESFCADRDFFNSIFSAETIDDLPLVYHQINNYKMFHNDEIEEIPLYELKQWQVEKDGIVCTEEADFCVKYYDISIEGREVSNWKQPLFKALGNAVFGLLIKRTPKGLKFLVKIRSEIGSFDKMELAPSIQWEPTHKSCDDDVVECFFRKRYEDKQGILLDVILSEEGGRFYQEQNKNVVIMVDEKDLQNVPADYMWVSFSTLNMLVQINNCLNIQLRNLLSTFEL